MRQKVRRTLLLITFLLFPIVMNYISPYVSISGAAEGFFTISLLVFSLLFITSIILGRAWCAWVCPVAGLQEACSYINNKKVNVKKLKTIRYIIFGIWLATLVTLLILAGGFKSVNLFYFTDNGISVDMPLKYIIYYSVLLILVVLNLTIGKRGSCHAICWMAPFMTAGYHIGKALKLPQLRVHTDKTKCTNCGTCNKKCPMSIDVNSMVLKGKIDASECILCGECIDNCKAKALKMSIK